MTQSASEDSATLNAPMSPPNSAMSTPAICAAITSEERAQLAQLLARIAEQQGLTPSVHPGSSQMGPRRTEGS